MISRRRRRRRTDLGVDLLIGWAAFTVTLVVGWQIYLAATAPPTPPPPDREDAGAWIAPAPDGPPLDFPGGIL